MNDKMKRLLELEAQIRYHDHLYFTADAPVISDAKYDELTLEYYALREEFPDYSPAATLGAEVPNLFLGTVPIIEPMLSIGKRKTREDFSKWIKANIPGMAIYEDKLDGMALRFIYEKGILTRIHTRGNYRDGTDVSSRRYLLKNLPDTIELHEDKDRVEFTGEAFCLYSDFEAYVERHGLNINEVDTRSTVSGLMKRLKVGDDEDLPIYIKIYSASKNVRETFDTYTELRDHFTDIGFDVPLLLEGGMLEEYLNLPEKPRDHYPIDGIVAKNNDLRSWDKPQTGQYFGYTICYKFPTVSLQTTVTGIDWSLNNRGYFVGTLTYEPVDYDGTQLKRCKLDYAETYFAQGLRLGATIKVTKSNEIIPRLVSLVDVGTGALLNWPTSCPFCQQLTVKEGPGYVKCVNAACEGQVVKRMTRLVEKKGLDIEGLAEKRIGELVERGFLTEPAQLFQLDDEALVICGVDVKTAIKVIEQVNDLNSKPLHRWLYALAMPGLGLTRAIEISNLSDKNGMNDGLKFSDTDSLMLIMSNGQYMSDMFGLDGLMIAKHVTDHAEEIRAFLDHYDFSNSHMENLNGIPVSVTGSWNAMTRDQLRDSLLAAGYVLSGTVTKTCCACLTGVKPSPSKVAKAEKWNLPVLDISSLTDIRDVITLLTNNKR